MFDSISEYFPNSTNRNYESSFIKKLSLCYNIQ